MTGNQVATPRLAESAPQALRILVIGGSRGIGLETVRLAVARGHTVTAMARRTKPEVDESLRLIPIEGDILDDACVRKVVAGQDAVVIAIGMGLSRRPVTQFSEGTENVLAAMAAANVRRLIAVTGMGAGDTRDHGGFFYDRIFRPLALQTVYDDKDRQEALIRERARSIPLAWTIVRPGVLNRGKAEHRYRVLTDLEGIAGGKIARADVAHFIVAALESGGYPGESPLLIN